MFNTEKNGQDTDIVIVGYEQGIQPSPHKGIANIQNGNIATETGEVMASYGRVQASMTSSSATGTLSFVDGTHVGLSISGTNNFFKGQWITVSGSTHGGELADGTYYVNDTSAGSAFQLEATYGGAIITGFTSGLAATIFLFRTMGNPIAYATETYVSTGVTYYRYYVLDNAGLVWVYDTINDVFPSDNLQYWFLPDNSITYFSPDATPSGIAVLNGWLMVFSGNKIWVKPTVSLTTYVQMTNALMMSQANSTNPHFALVGHQGRCYYTDGSYVGAITPNTGLLTNIANIQSYASYTTSTTTGTIAQLFSGSVPSDGNITSVRIPAVFFASTGGAPATALTANTVFYIAYSLANATFQVFAAITGGSALDITTGKSGTQYFNTFYPVGTHSGAFGDTPTMTFSPQRLNLPIFETAQCIAEVGSLTIIGGKTNTLYPWNGVDITPGNFIFLPESNTKQLLTVNQMVYVFAGYKGHVYITDGSVASLVIKVPDYCAGIAGTPSSYIEPNFTWGGSMYLRGRVYFSVLDQTTTKAGNCGGVWSFIPTQNLYIGQDTGIALRLENQNSYGTYNGYATILIPWFIQTAQSPQYWSTWISDSVTSPSYGIDKTETHPVGNTVIETDLIPVGTVLDKYTGKQIEYKLATPLVASESVSVSWRKNATDSFTSAGNVITPDGTTSLSGYFQANFQGSQWVQLRVTLTPLQSNSTSFVRLSQIRLR